MSGQLTAIETLYGETAALQIVVQRLLGHMALSSGHDPKKVMRTEHELASAELAKMSILTDRPDFADAIRSHAQEILDEIYTVASTSRKKQP